MRVISASRRTDIPAFYTPWLLGRLKAGFCHWVNPFGGQVYRVSLSPEDVLALVLWTRDPRPLLTRLDELDGLGFAGRSYFHVTVNGYPPALDPCVPDVRTILPALRTLVARVGPERVLWRYDPIVLSADGPLSARQHVRRFASLAAALDGLTGSCSFSFATWYAKTGRRLDAVSRAEDLTLLREPPLEDRRRLAAELCGIAAAHGIRLSACCGPELTGSGVRLGHCVDGALVQALRPDLDLRLAAVPTRPGCGCCAATDIGAFDTCLGGCAYCYATAGQAVARRRHREHDPSDSLLWRPARLRGLDLAAVEVELRPGRSRVGPPTTPGG